RWPAPGRLRHRHHRFQTSTAQI
ncbi:uncharacterized protein METZ01_LOCUS259550, partial [marine metagenome]